MEIIRFLNENSGALNFISSLAVALSTIVYVFLTTNLVRETQETRKAQTEPRIQVTYRLIEQSLHSLDVSVKNVGAGPAEDINFIFLNHLDHDVDRLVEKLLKLSFFRSGLTYLGPGQEHRSFWTTLHGIDLTKVGQISIQCKYRSVTRRPYDHKCTIDLRELEGLSRLGDLPLHSMAKDIAKIQANIHRVCGRRVQVDTFDRADRMAEEAALDKRMQRGEP